MTRLQTQNILQTQAPEGFEDTNLFPDKETTNLADSLRPALGQQEQTVGDALSQTAANVQRKTTIDNVANQGGGDTGFDAESYFEKQLNGNGDSDAIRKQITQSMQREISATEDIYADLIRRQELENKGFLGSNRAIQARGGLLGSDFGAAQTQNQVNANQDLIRGIGAEKSAAISAIMGEGSRALVKELQDKRIAQNSSVKDYINFLEGQQDRNLNRSNSLVNALIAQGIDPSEMTPEELSQVAKSYNLTENDILSSYQSSLSDEGELQKLSEGQSLVDSDGNVVYKNNKTYKPEDNSVNYSNSEKKEIERTGLPDQETSDYFLTFPASFRDTYSRDRQKNGGESSMDDIYNSYQKYEEEKKTAGTETLAETLQLLESLK
jgi:hypothetical protein